KRENWVAPKVLRQAIPVWEKRRDSAHGALSSVDGVRDSSHGVADQGGDLGIGLIGDAQGAKKGVHGAGLANSDDLEQCFGRRSRAMVWARTPRWPGHRGEEVHWARLPGASGRRPS
ncbi:unnamed protein product, partial [Ilex paraguariensis]